MYYVTFSIYTKHPPPVQPSLLVGWLFYNFKSSKPNGLASPFERKTEDF